MLVPGLPWRIAQAGVSDPSFCPWREMPRTLPSGGSGTLGDHEPGCPGQTLGVLRLQGPLPPQRRPQGRQESQGA